MLKTKRDEIMKAILPAIIHADKDSSAYSIVSFADQVINALEEKNTSKKINKIRNNFKKAK